MASEEDLSLVVQARYAAAYLLGTKSEIGETPEEFRQQN